MKLNKYIKNSALVLGLAGTCLSYGCNKDAEKNQNEPRTINGIYLKGKPLSVSVNEDIYYSNPLRISSLACVVDVDGTKVLAVSRPLPGNLLFINRISRYNRNLLEAEALIQSEINDGDDDKITLYGASNRASMLKLLDPDYYQNTDLKDRLEKGEPLLILDEVEAQGFKVRF